MNPAPIKALVLFPGALGDLLCCWPALAALRATGHSVVLAARSDAAEVLPPAAVTICSIDRREVADLFASGPLARASRELFAGFDRIDSFTGAGDPHVAARLADAAGRPTAVHAFRGMRAGEHASAYYARCLGVTPRPDLLPVRDEAAAWAETLWRRHRLDERVLVIHAGSGGVAKNWEGMADVARDWRRAGGRVVALIGPAEIERDATVSADVVVAGEPLAHVAAVVRRADRYLGNDSGISHLAGLLGAAALVLFADTDPATWAPSGPRARVLRAGPICAECGPGTFCAHRLSVTTVLAALA